MARKASHPAANAFRLAHSASHLLHRAEQFAADRFSHLGGESVTLRQFAVLAAIAEQPGLSQSDLVRATGIDRSTLADMMNRLAKRGLVARAASASDARAYAVRLSAAGVAMLNATAKHARAADTAVLQLLPRAERKSFLATLTKLARLAEAADLKPERVPKTPAKRAPRGRHANKHPTKRKGKGASARAPLARRERV